MQLKDMKIDRKEVDEAKETAMVGPETDYPYGLNIRLDEEAISKLGLEKLPMPGADVYIYAKATVESASVRKDKDKTSRDLTLQIKKMGLSDSSEGMDVKEGSERVDKQSNDGPSVTKVLYGD